jgi:hypothetical protein
MALYNGDYLNSRSSHQSEVLNLSTSRYAMLILSTLPHYLSIQRPWSSYNIIVILSSSFSVIWHWYGEPKNIIYYLDYFFALVWFLADVYRSRRANLKSVIILNTIVFITNICIKYNSDYWLYHSLWHLLSSGKSLYISTCCQVANVFSSPYPV